MLNFFKHIYKKSSLFEAELPSVPNYFCPLYIYPEILKSSLRRAVIVNLITLRKGLCPGNTRFEL